jgi:hypothetical protein
MSGGARWSGINRYTGGSDGHVHACYGRHQRSRQGTRVYDAVLAPLGYKRLKDLGDRGSCWDASSEEFMVLTPADGKPAASANGGTVSFMAPSRAAVAAFHRAALAAGGKDEGAVGPRGFLCRLLPRSRRQ